MIIDQATSTPVIKQPFSDQKFVELVTAGRYEQAAEVIHKAQMATEQAKNIEVSNLLAAARLMCLTAGQNHVEMEWHQWAAQEADKRRTESIQRLCELLEVVDYRMAVEHEMAVKPEGIIVSHRVYPQTSNMEKRTRNHSVWQLIIKLLKREIPALTSRPEESSTDLLVPEDPPVTGKRQSAENELVIYCLGTFQVYYNNQLIENWPSRKGALILKYLIMNRERQVHKEVLMDLFWPDSEEEAQRNNLNVAIYGLRQTLRNGNSSFSHILFQNDCYFLNQEQSIWTDYAAFSEHFKNAQRLDQQGQQKAAIQEYIAAEALYEGVFLPEDCYEEWTDSQRQSLQTAYLSLLDQLSSYYLQASDYPACIAICHKMLTADTCLEEAHVRLMRCYSRQGQHYLALRQYDRCAKVLEEELEIAPMPETIALHGQIRVGKCI